MIENALVVVTATRQLTKQQTSQSVTLADNSVWIFSCQEHGWSESLFKEQEKHPTLDAFGDRQMQMQNYKFCSVLIYNLQMWKQWENAKSAGRVMTSR